jgi:putative tryptophan/tyrosine transport system substrate-binding protein
LATMTGWSEYAHAGCLVAYGVNFSDLFRRAASYVDKILHGTAPGDLPIVQPERFELVVNLRTARALGLTIPAPVLVEADQLIE